MPYRLRWPGSACATPWAIPRAKLYLPSLGGVSRGDDELADIGRGGGGRVRGDDAGHRALRCQRQLARVPGVAGLEQLADGEADRGGGQRDVEGEQPEHGRPVE